MGESVPYNPDIANAFYKAGYIETWGRGIEKIIKACREIGAKDPEYEVEFGDITIRFEAIALDYTSDKASNNTSDDVLSDALNDVLNEDEKRLVRLIIAAPAATQSWYSEESGFSIAKIQRMMKKLQSEKIIWRSGSKKKGTWEVAGFQKRSMRMDSVCMMKKETVCLRT